ncbi:MULTISPECIES: hypothetical protein [unclassified Coleofasciculus]|uniref:hypothetical protein n=1 Tax=unclassified Coleofasciculus TaxID=2692782 RepID=UPI00187EF700|nr:MULTISPECIES: hypothetical protein [unclassified Coleofasciculus]MBE9126907.1 hypothetical protein [Coleofasciculus sp. LEGE 07081]MBE9150197.1 hypothetical protein [Coleofasciculus sp. LEGE 07092]
METAQELANNLLILTVYLIVVVLVFNRAFKSLEGLVIFETETDSLNKQLEEKNLNDLINIKFSFAQSYKLDELKFLSLTIENKSKESFIEIDWKQCFISDFSKRIRQAVRSIPGTPTPDVAQSSKIPPGQKIEEKISDEDISASLFDPKKLQEAAQKEDDFFLQFPLKISEPGKDARSCNLRCTFIAKVLPWQRAFVLALKP